MEFNLIDIEIKVQADDVIRFSQCLPTLCREFTHVFKKIACRWPTRDCNLCSVQEQCAWQLVFGQKLTVDPMALKHHQKPPLPFVFSFPILIKPAEKEPLIKCGLVVIGRAIQYLEIFLEAFTELLHSDSCPVGAEVIQVGSCDYQGAVLPFANENGDIRPEDLIVLSAEGLMESRTWLCNGLGIRFLSPLRLIENGRPLVRFDFNRFVRSLMRRVSALAYYYSDFEFDCDFKELSHQVETIICTDDHFIHTNISKMSGITGYGSFSGELRILMPFLLLGTYLHAGKAAAFGMGRYELLFDEFVS